MKNFIVRESFLPAAGYFAEGSESEGAEKMSFSDLFHLFLSCPLNFGDSLHGANSLYVIVYICCAVLRELMPFKKLKKGPILKYALHKWDCSIWRSIGIAQKETFSWNLYQFPVSMGVLMKILDKVTCDHTLWCEKFFQHLAREIKVFEKEDSHLMGGKTPIAFGTV